jgi:hypothetical protein
MSEPLKFERMAIEAGDNLAKRPLYRAQMPGGWLVRSLDQDNSTLLFIADPKHEWDVTIIEPKAT